MDDFNAPNRVEPASDADERTMLLGWLDYHRETLAAKCAGLTDDQLKQRSVAPSTMSLLGLVRHLTDVERTWIRERFDGQAGLPHYWSEANYDDDFDALDDTPVEQVWASWRAEHQAVGEVLDRSPDLAQTTQVRRHNGGHPSLRWILTHLIEEYARHNGHADLLREAIDGQTGE
jgi:uncharacterized damage-inducible protein DinB